MAHGVAEDAQELHSAAGSRYLPDIELTSWVVHRHNQRAMFSAEVRMTKIALTEEQRRVLQGERVRLRDLPTPPAVSAEAQRWCRKDGWWGQKRRREVEEQFKLQFYFGGQAIYLLETPEGPVVIPIPERDKDTPDLRYGLLTPEERPRACLTVPSRWQDADSEILNG
jgi:hypothetical protein